MKSRNFVLVITETPGLSFGELTAALSRTAANLSAGRALISGGLVRNSEGKIIGSYDWQDRELDPGETG